MKKINFKQPKYVLPLILYPLILGTGYFVIGMFTTEVKSVDKNLMATNYLNSELPEAHIDEELRLNADHLTAAFHNSISQHTHKSDSGPTVDQTMSRLSDPSADLQCCLPEDRFISFACSQINGDIHACALSSSLDTKAAFFSSLYTPC